MDEDVDKRKDGSIISMSSQKSDRSSSPPGRSPSKIVSSVVPKGQRRIDTFFLSNKPKSPKVEKQKTPSPKKMPTPIATVKREVGEAVAHRKRSIYVHDNRLLSPTLSSGRISVSRPKKMPKVDTLTSAEYALLRQNLITRIMNTPFPREHVDRLAALGLAGGKRIGRFDLAKK